MSELKRVLLNQGMTPEEAEEAIEEMTERVICGENPEDVLDDFGLESDYIFDIIG